MALGTVNVGAPKQKTNFAPITHAAQHKKDGADPIVPSDIGAADETHAAQHKKDGADPIAPSDIGAADEEHTHAASDISAGTFAGHVAVPKGDYMTYETPYVRNAVLLDGMWADESVVSQYCGDGDFALIYE